MPGLYYPRLPAETLRAVARQPIHHAEKEFDRGATLSRSALLETAYHGNESLVGGAEESAMKTAILLAACILMTGSPQTRGPEAGAGAQPETTREEAELASALAGRVAGPPQDCVNERDLGDNKSYGKSAIVLRSRVGDVLWVSRPPAGCPGLRFGLAIKTRTTSMRLCSGDIVTVLDPVSGVEFGSCALGPFTPYRRVE